MSDSIDDDTRAALTAILPFVTMATQAATTVPAARRAA